MDRSNKRYRAAFQSQALVFISKPKREWLSHTKCVWTAPKLLSRVTKLFTHYRNCGDLFQSVLGVERAGTQEVVHEFCRPPLKKNFNVEQHFKEMIFLLERFHKKSRLTQSQIDRIRSASVFPVLVKTVDISEEDSSRIEMRSLNDVDDLEQNSWYIPDIVTFEAAFRGKVDMLALSVQSVRALKDFFVDLRCDVEFLSEAVTQCIKPTGMTVHNGPEERDLRERLGYISQ